MFATLLGALPMPSVDAHGEPIAWQGRVAGSIEYVDETIVAVAVAAQEAAGLEPVTDGRLGDPAFERLAGLLGVPSDVAAARRSVLEAWHRTAGHATRAAKQALPGPYSVGVRSGVAARDRVARMHAAADALAEIVAALAAAGCPLVEIEESEAHRAVDDLEVRVFGEAHRRLLGGSSPGAIHRSLSITGGSVPAAAIASVIELPYASLAVDLVAGPDNWYVVRRASRDQGVIAGALSGGEVDEGREVMLWAANYASSGSGRARERVGLGSSGSWAHLTWDAARRKLDRLGDAARLASMPPGDALVRELDPRAVSKRRAAMGHPADPDGGNA